MPNKIEIVTALLGCWRLVRGDPDGLRFFRADETGFWGAAWAVLIALPAQLIALAMLMQQKTDLNFGLFDLLVEAEVFAVTWFGYALGVFYGLQLLDRQERFFHYIVPYLWVSVPLIYLDALVGLLQYAGILPDGLVTPVMLALLGVAIWVRWFIASTALRIPAGQAVTVVALSLVFDTVVTVTLSPMIP